MQGYKNPLIVCVLALLIAGCETMGMGSNSGADPLLQQDKPTFISKSGVQACLIGAGVGALGCLFASRENQAACMAVAAAAGCGVGAGANYLLDQRRAQYSNNEQRMNAYIADIQADTQNLQKYMVNVRTVLDNDQRRLAQIQQDIQSRSADQRQLQQELNGIRANRQALLKTIEELDEKIASYQVIAEEESTIGVSSSKMLQQLTQLQRERDDLQRLVEQTYSTSLII
jgi:hypothetical protein